MIMSEPDSNLTDLPSDHGLLDTNDKLPCVLDLYRANIRVVRDSMYSMLILDQIDNGAVVLCSVGC